jgi:hypothetical protein
LTHILTAPDKIHQFANVLAETAAWEDIVAGSTVLTPRTMRIVIHFQLLYTIAFLSWVRRSLRNGYEGVERENEYKREHQHDHSGSPPEYDDETPRNANSNERRSSDPDVDDLL